MAAFIYTLCSLTCLACAILLLGIAMKPYNLDSATYGRASR